jgi:hypothetical protein
MAKSKAYRRYLSTNSAAFIEVDSLTPLNESNSLAQAILDDINSKPIAKPRKKKVAPDAVDVYPKFTIEEEE